MLAEQGVISSNTPGDRRGPPLNKASIDAGDFEFDINNEDIHMSVERVSTEKIGDAGARLHTGRSRNDQVATDTRLFCKKRCTELMEANIALRHALIEQAEAHFNVICRVTRIFSMLSRSFSHHMLAYVWMLTRDYERLSAAYRAADANPLGSAALAGTTYPLDRFKTTKTLGFDHPIPNSLDAVSDRDFLLDLIYACSVFDRTCLGCAKRSSCGPRPNSASLRSPLRIRRAPPLCRRRKTPISPSLSGGKSGRVIGDLVALLVTMKALPLAYNKDLQEDKEGAIDAAQTLEDCYLCMAGMISTMQVHPVATTAQAKKGYLAATDVADYLPRKGMPFRRAHEVVGHLVLLCEKRGCDLEGLAA